MKMLKIILNCTQHELTDNQKKDLLSVSYVVSLKEENKQLFDLLANSPDNESEINKLAQKFIDFLTTPNYDGDYKYDYIILPIGSPAFNYRFSQLLQRAIDTSYTFNIRVLFSHSERISRDELQMDGTIKKTTTFQHKQWIKF